MRAHIRYSRKPALESIQQDDLPNMLHAERDKSLIENQNQQGFFTTQNK